jgi:AcrR family transcriptional regulator
VYDIRTLYDLSRNWDQGGDLAASDTTTETRTPLSRERVLRAAVALADRDGLESLTMRKLADELGAGAMSLYHYVRGKEQLLAGMIDIVFSEIELPTTDVDWRTAMRRRAQSTRAALNRHRWAVGRMEGTHTGLANARVHDAVLGCLRQAGFSIEMTIQAMSVQDAYIYGFALQEKDIPFETAEESAEVAARQGWDDEALAKEFPHLAEVVAGHVAKVGYDFTEAFEYGLDLILDALEQRRDGA